MTGLFRFSQRSTSTNPKVQYMNGDILKFWSLLIILSMDSKGNKAAPKLDNRQNHFNLYSTQTIWIFLIWVSIHHKTKPDFSPGSLNQMFLFTVLSVMRQCHNRHRKPPTASMFEPQAFSVRIRACCCTQHWTLSQFSKGHFVLCPFQCGGCFWSPSGWGVGGLYLLLIHSKDSTLNTEWEKIKYRLYVWSLGDRF